MNVKQEQLINELFEKVKQRFPEIELINLQVSPDDSEHIWINVLADMDEEREIELTDYASELAVDILIDYGYAISIMPENPNAVYA